MRYGDHIVAILKEFSETPTRASTKTCVIFTATSAFYYNIAGLGGNKWEFKKAVFLPEFEASLSAVAFSEVDFVSSDCTLHSIAESNFRSLLDVIDRALGRRVMYTAYAEESLSAGGLTTSGWRPSGLECLFASDRSGDVTFFLNENPTLPLSTPPRFKLIIIDKVRLRKVTEWSSSWFHEPFFVISEIQGDGDVPLTNLKFLVSLASLEFQLVRAEIGKYLASCEISMFESHYYTFILTWFGGLQGSVLVPRSYGSLLEDKRFPRKLANIQSFAIQTESFKNFMEIAKKLPSLTSTDLISIIRRTEDLKSLLFLCESLTSELYDKILGVAVRKLFPGFLNQLSLRLMNSWLISPDDLNECRVFSKYRLIFASKFETEYDTLLPSYEISSICGFLGTRLYSTAQKEDIISIFLRLSRDESLLVEDWNHLLKLHDEGLPYFFESAYFKVKKQTIGLISNISLINFLERRQTLFREIREENLWPFFDETFNGRFNPEVIHDLFRDIESINEYFASIQQMVEEARNSVVVID